MERSSLSAEKESKKLYRELRASLQEVKDSIDGKTTLTDAREVVFR